MTKSKKTPQQHLKEHIRYFLPTEQKKLGKHFTAVPDKDLGLEKIVGAGHKTPEDTAHAIAQAYYKQIGHDLGVYTTKEEVLGHLYNQIGQKAYQKVIDALESGDIEEASKLIKESHQEQHRMGVNQIKLDSITKLPYETQEGIAQAIINANPDIFDKKATPASLIPKLSTYIQLIAKHEDSMQAAKGVVGDEYTDQMKEVYEAGKKKKKKDDS